MPKDPLAPDMPKNIFDREHLKENNDAPLDTSALFHQSFIPAKAFKNRHIDGLIIETGLAADRPNGTTWTKAYFATDTFVLSIWTGTAWKSVTLS